jgi:hypothetical protein
MEDNRIISPNLSRERKRKNLLSLRAHVFGCLVEIGYIFAIFCVRILGKRFFPEYSDFSREFIDSFFITQFALTSTLQILVSPGVSFI